MVDIPRAREKIIHGAVIQAVVVRPLSSPHGDLAKLIPTEVIKLGNKHVESAISRGNGQKYQKLKVSVQLKTNMAENSCRCL